MGIKREGSESSSTSAVGIVGRYGSNRRSRVTSSLSSIISSVGSAPMLLLEVDMQGILLALGRIGTGKMLCMLLQSYAIFAIVPNSGPGGTMLIASLCMYRGCYYTGLPVVSSYAQSLGIQANRHPPVAWVMVMKGIPLKVRMQATSLP